MPIGIISLGKGPDGLERFGIVARSADGTSLASGHMQVDTDGVYISVAKDASVQQLVTALATANAALAGLGDNTTGLLSDAHFEMAIGAQGGNSGYNPPAGGTGVLGFLSGIFKAITGTLSVSGTFWQATQPVSAAALPLPAGAATETTLAGIKSVLQAQANLASTLWTDNTGAFFVRRDTIVESTGVVTITFTDPSGTAASPGAGLKPVAVAGQAVIQATFDAKATGTGYTNGDALERFTIVDQAAIPPIVVASGWINLTTGAVIAAPSSADVVEATKNVTLGGSLPAGSALVGKVGLDQTTPGTTNKVSLGSDIVNTAPANSGPGVNASVSAPAVGNVIATVTVSVAGAYYVQNQSAAQLGVVFDDGAGGNISTLLLDPSPLGAGYQGGDTGAPMAFFTGRIRITGPNGSQCMIRYK